MTAQDPVHAGACPDCGAELRRLPTLENEGYLLSCETCGYESGSPQVESEPGESSGQGPVRFRELLAAQRRSSPSDLPPEILDQLLEEARSALGASEGTRADDAASLSPDMEQHLKEHGYFLSTDGRGPRLSTGGPRRPGTGDLSAFDLVRLAAEMEGGVPGPGQRVACPHCQAMIAVGTSRCPWCDTDIDWDQLNR